MDNITITTIALHKSRQHQSSRKRIRSAKRLISQSRRESFTRWVTSLNPKFYVFFRVTGPHELQADPNISITLYLMPCMIVENCSKLYGLFEDNFRLHVRINQAIPCVDEEGQNWLSVDATATTYPGQYVVVGVPPQYDRYSKEILSQIAYPANIRERKHRDDTPTFNSTSKLRFHRFHLFYHLSDKDRKRYGVIDQMWNPNGHELPINLPSAFDFDNLKPVSPPSPQTKPINITPYAEPQPDAKSDLKKEFDAFLNSKTWANVHTLPR